MTQTVVQHWGRDLFSILEQLPALHDRPFKGLPGTLSPPVEVSTKPRNKVHAESLNYMPPQFIAAGPDARSVARGAETRISHCDVATTSQYSLSRRLFRKAN